MWRHARIRGQDPARARRAEFLLLGGSQKVSVDVRIISSTSRDLEREMGDGRFRVGPKHRLNRRAAQGAGACERRETSP